MELPKTMGSDIPITSGDKKYKSPSTRPEQPKQPNTPVVSKNKNLDEKETKQVVDTLNNMLGMTQTHLKFRYHEKSGEYYVQLVNNQSEEVVKEIPSKRMLDIKSAMSDFIGIIVNKKA